MKSIIITVAGTARRFNRDTSKDTLKCLYYLENPYNSLLCQIIDKCINVDEIIIVGGYLFEDLSNFVKTQLVEFLPKIKLVFNPEFDNYGSGYSLYLGVKSVSEFSDEILFVEGDLFFDKETFGFVNDIKNDVITINGEPIYSNKSVVLYLDKIGKPHYIYDTSHNLLYIDEEFSAIFNSGQVWKFINVPKLKQVVGFLSEHQIKGTNLEIVGCYFSNLTSDEYLIIKFEYWYNCNTVLDYNMVFERIKAWKD
jgi:choline kinase